MKKTIRILTAVILSFAIVLCSMWYLFSYDREFTRDVLLGCAREMESNGNHNAAAWFYNLAYAQSDNSDDVAIELAFQYRNSKNYTKAEYTLYNAISKGAGIDVYIALSKLYVEQDKLLDAVTMLNGIANPQIKEQLDALRPAAPTASPDPGFYNQYISVTIQADADMIYVSTDKQYPTVASGTCSSPITLSDGENTIQALSVAENGLVSQLSVFGYTVGGVVELVEFTDPAIETDIRGAINAGTDTQLYTNDLWGIKSFKISESAKDYSNIRQMAFLENLTIENGVSDQLSNISALSNLTELTISNTAVSQEVLTSIASLPNLKRLTLTNCSITNIDVLKKAVAITHLDLSNNAIRDIGSISSMANIIELRLQHNAIVDISPISGNIALTTVDISHNALTTLAPIASLTALTHLDANTNSITTLGDLSKLSMLNYLSLSSNQLSDISQLSGCSSLTELYLASNAISDLSALASLEQIQRLDFSHNQVTDLPKWSTSCALVSIDGSYNLLSSLDHLSGLEHLNVVNMDYNENIKKISSLAKCPSLLEVNVYGTRVTDVKDLTDLAMVVNYNPVQ